MLCGSQTFCSGPPGRTGLEPDVTYHLFCHQKPRLGGHPLSSGETWLGPHVVSPFPSRRGSWPGKYLASELAVAETVVCVSRPHLNPSSVVSVWSGLGLSSLPFALVRASRLLRQLRPGQGEQCRQLPAPPGCREVPRAVAQAGPGVGAAQAGACGSGTGPSSAPRALAQCLWASAQARSSRTVCYLCISSAKWA